MPPSFFGRILVKKRRNRVPNADRAVRDVIIGTMHRDGRLQKDIALSLGIGISTVNDALKRSGLTQSYKHSGPKLTRMEIMTKRMAGTRPLSERAMTREQVDPEFKGSKMDWVDKYGHVQLHNAEEMARMRFTDWAIEIGYIAKLIAGKKLPEVDINWLRSPKEADVARLQKAMEILRPIVDRADAMLAVTRVVVGEHSFEGERPAQ
jgi:hypothetical protein